MKILLFGKNGQVGWELDRSLIPLGDVVSPDRVEADFSRPEELRAVVRNVKPDIIVNAAAYTAVDKAEKEEELAAKINGEAPAVLAEEATALNSLIVHYSTDYVFDGHKRSPYIESDEPAPINAYGRTKLSGDLAIQSIASNYLILRTSWVYSSRGANFLLSILRLAREKEELNIVDDQKGTPTWARNIADMTALLIYASIGKRLTGEFVSGIYNLASDGETSWFDFSREILNIASQLKIDESFLVKRINPIPGSEYSTPAKRPDYSVLSTEKVERELSFSPVMWKRALMCCMETMK